MTTGEAAKILGVSRSTATRMVTKGKLFGKVNVLTGKRDISSSSIYDFLVLCTVKGKKVQEHFERLEAFDSSCKAPFEHNCGGDV